MNARAITAALGGSWHGSYGRVPGPGHSQRDRSVGVIDGRNGELIIHSYAGEDWREIKKAWKEAGLLNNKVATSRRPFPSKLSPPPLRPPSVNLSLWQRTKRITVDDCAGRYLMGRGCLLPDPDGDLRWLPGLWHHPTRTHWPALIGRITHAATAEPMSLHFTFLRSDGSGKAPLERQRHYLYGHHKQGGVIRLWPDANVTLGLALAEGIETALCAAQEFQPIWSALDAGNLKDLPVLEGIEALTIFADDDKDGIAAAEELRDRWINAGREVRVWQVQHG